MEQTITKRFIDTMRDLAQQEIPESVIREAKYCMIDYIACATLGASLLNDKDRKFMRQFGTDSGKVSVVGTGIKTTVLTAAMLNGMNAHEIELDDGHRYAMLHLGAPVISAMLAVAQNTNMDVKHFIKGIIIGYEATIRLASAVQPGHKLKGYHATGTCGTIGAALGIAAALDYDEKQWNCVISAAATASAGLLQVIDDGSELKPYNAGHAAAAAINAAYMGSTGLHGPTDVLGGHRGFFQTMTDKVKEEYLLNGFMPVYGIEGIYRKPYAACRHCHAAIEAVLHICKENSIHAEDIKKITVFTYGLAVKGHEHIEIKGASSAKMSMPYSVAAAVLYGRVNYQQYETECLENPELERLMKLVDVKEDPELSRLVPAKRAADVIIKTDDGSFQNRVDYPLGEPENRMSQEMLEEKYFSLMEAAGRKRTECRKILDDICHIEDSFEEFLQEI